MPSETIWSNSTKPQEPAGSSYRSVLDALDNDVNKMLSNYSDSMSLNGDFSPFSLNDGSDADVFGLKPTALSAITAPVGYQTAGSQTGKRPPFGTASISGGIASRHPPQDSFLQKFSSVAEATRDIELSSNLGKLKIDGPSSRRTSFNSKPDIKPLTDMNGISPHGSLNESLNIPTSRTSRHQSISEKIDHYNNSSPIQTGATLSISSDLNSTKDAAPQNFWNPATASSFTPSMGYNYGGDMYSGVAMPPPNFNPYVRPGQVAPITPPPFMQAMQFVDPRVFNMMGYESAEQLKESTSLEKEETESSDSNGDTKRKDFSHLPGIGMPNRQMMNPGFMFQPFNPYIFQQPPVVNGQEVDSQTATTTDSSPKAKTSPKPAPPSTEPKATSPNHGPTTSSTSRKNFKNGSGKGGSHIYRSPLLEEVRSNFKGKEYFLKDIYGHAIEFTKDQHGSRFIQQKLPTASEEEKEVIFNEIRDISYELMTDVFGNYVIQKFFEYGSTTQKNVMLENMIGHIYDLSLQMYGCRVVQRALEAINLDGQIRIISELKEHILVCAKDQNGNHVIQKSIERVPFEKVRFILESLENQIYHLSTHPYGCRVIQRLLEYSTVNDQQKILSELNKFIFYLIQDQYGNYVMQHILERGRPQDREAILEVVLGSVVNFSKHKFASNVIEKCIKSGDFNQRKRILHEVLMDNEDLSIETVGDDSPLALMMKDQYANYVIQKLVEGFDTKSQEKRLLVLKLRQYLKQISSKNSYGKHLASVEKMIIVAETALIEAENA